jgi:S-disulfanyl-L-cysteine oxidoreductase SoxD
MLKTVISTTAFIFALGFTFAIAVRGQESGATVWDKVYTTAQATRGKEAYMTECSACHSEDLGGSGYAPALKGDDFAFAWNDKTLGDVFDRIRRLMPPDNPGSLTPDRYRDIIAFLLQENKYPDGDRELSAESPALHQIKITAAPAK